MDPRTAAHILEQIGALLELHGADRFKSRAYSSAARAVLSVEAEDICEPLRSGELRNRKGLGPATLSVLEDLCATGDSSYLDRLREDSPEGLLEMMRVPGLGTAKIHLIHRELGVETLHELDEAARDGRLAGLPRFGKKTAEKILKGIAYLRETSSYVLYPHALAESRQLLAWVLRHPDVERAAVTGSLRRHREVIRDIDIVAACRTDPAAVAASFARAPSVKNAIGVGGRSVAIRFVDGTLLDLHCVEVARFPVALWRATGSEEHESQIRTHAGARGFTIVDDEIRSAQGDVVNVTDETNLYALLGLPYIEPEIREARGELAAALRHQLPSLVTAKDIRGALHCHSEYSDGTATIAEMAAAARSRGWSYLGISDHSQSAFYAGGLTREAVQAQHDEIDRFNEAANGFRVLKGIEADILADGRLDYDPDFLERFDYVIASVHSRFGMEQAGMTDRVIRALEQPHVTILGHPTGRLLLTREAYPIDMDAVLRKALETGVAVELNADPHRLDLDWRLCHTAKTLGVAVEIGPDAHSTQSLDNMEYGIGIARKGWLEPADVLNAQSADDVLAQGKRRSLT
ncbi:MAG: DNA polymerase/3'-5' exonuclease PolX [Gemmatimonadaceae bacterium]